MSTAPTQELPPIPGWIRWLIEWRNAWLTICLFASIPAYLWWGAELGCLIAGTGGFAIVVLLMGINWLRNSPYRCQIRIARVILDGSKSPSRANKDAIVALIGLQHGLL